MTQKIQIRRGLKQDLPILAIGEFGYCTDSEDLYVGSSTGNILIHDKNNKTTIGILQDTSKLKDGQIVNVVGFYSIGDKCVGNYLVKNIDGLEVWGSSFTIDGFRLTLSSNGEIKASSTLKLVPLLENGSLNLRLLGLSEKGTSDNAPIFNVGMNAFSDVTINGSFNTNPIYVTRDDAIYRGYATLNNFSPNQEYIIKVKAKRVRFLGYWRLFGNRSCKNGFIGENWAGSYIEDILVDSFTRWGLIGKFTPSDNSNSIQIGHSQTNLCGSFLDTYFTTLNYDTTDSNGISTLNLVDAIPDDINKDYLYSMFVRINQKQIGSINAGSSVLTVVNKAGIRQTETLTITGLNDVDGNPINFKVIGISGNNITLDQTASQTVTNGDVYVRIHYLPIYGINGSWDMGTSIVDSNTIKIHSTANKDMGATAQGKIRVLIGGGIHIEGGNDNNIWDFNACHNVANNGIAVLQGNMYGNSYQRFEATLNEIGFANYGTGYGTTLGTPYFESNGEDIVSIGNTNHFSIYEPIFPRGKIYQPYEKNPDSMQKRTSMINTGIFYGDNYEYLSYMWADSLVTFIGGKTYIIDYSRPSTDTQTFELSSTTNFSTGKVIRILISPDYKSTITFKSKDLAYSISGVSTYVDLSGCEVLAFKDNITFTWRLFINKTALTFDSSDATLPTVAITPSNGSTFSGTSQNVVLRPNEASTIYYTLDGSTPTTSSNIYTGTFTITNTTTIKYFAKDKAGNSGTVSTATITKV